MEFQFYLLDITYKMLKDKAVLYLFGRTRDGQQICLIDNSFIPYFYVIPKHGANIKEKIEKLEKEEFKVLKVEQVKKKFLEKEIDALKVFVNIPKGVPEIRNIIKEWDDTYSTNEYDILFVRRYLIDKGITPLTVLNVKGEKTTEKLKIPAVKLESIEQASADTIENPKILAVDIETYNPHGNIANPTQDPIVMIGLYSKGFQKVITWKKFKTEEKYIEFVQSESDMIERFKELVEEFRPDFVTGYYSDGFDFPFIETRAKKYKIKMDLGLDYSELQISGRTMVTAKIKGIAHIDLLRFVKQAVRKTLKTDVFTLNAVANELIGEQKLDVVDIANLAKAWDSGSDELNEFAKYNLQDARITFKLFEKLWPNMIELVKVVGLPIYNIIRMSFSQLVEWYIIRQAKAFNEIAPNKPSYHEKKARMTQRIKGAFVFEPKPGLYNDIIVCDYRSLYPTIIASHNISPGTLNCTCCESAKKVPAEEFNLWFCEKRKGLISSVIEDLITRRARIKEMLKKNYNTALNARSWALKDMANSMYGYLAFANARWYSHDSAEATTAYARYYIKKVIKDAETAGFKVLYGDTDSVFLELNEKSIKDANKFVEKINFELPGLMELEFEGFFPSGIFVAAKGSESGAKKKYALIDEKDNIKITGFEAVRRNWSPIAKDVQRKVLNIILKENEVEKAVKYVKNTIKSLRAYETPIDQLIIHTILSKEIEDYVSIGPHVAAARIMKSKGIDVGPGSRIRFVITKGKGLIREKVKLPEDIKNTEYDPEYYVKHQILPGVEKIFAALGYSKEELFGEGSQSKLGSFT